MSTTGLAISRVDWRVAASVSTPDAPVWPLRQFAVEAARPGVQV